MSSRIRNSAARRSKKNGCVRLFKRKMRKLTVNRLKRIPCFALFEIKAVVENRKRKKSGKKKGKTANLKLEIFI